MLKLDLYLNSAQTSPGKTTFTSTVIIVCVYICLCKTILLLCCQMGYTLGSKGLNILRKR